MREADLLGAASLASKMAYPSALIGGMAIIFAIGLMTAADDSEEE